MTGAVTRWSFIALDLLFAALYLVIGRLARTADGSFELASFVVAGAMLLAAVGTFSKRRWGRLLAAVACGTVLLFAFGLFALLVSSAAFLRGVFGPLGQGASLVALVMAALALELYVLLPLFQLVHLLRAHRAARES
ncbi:MAG: hypothetical protein EXR73_09210 [Myxococcales bacterium]|nr:hypothetical protein [Myxococcales bacterium]